MPLSSRTVRRVVFSSTITDSLLTLLPTVLCQSEAIYNCDILLLYIELSLDENYINDKSCEYWVRQVMDVKKMILAWKNGDLKRSSF